MGSTKHLSRLGLLSDDITDLLAAEQPRPELWRQIAFWCGIGALFWTTLFVLLALWAVGPVLVGWDSNIVSSGSMTPALERGDVLVSQPSTGVGLGRGTIAVFRTDAGTVTHRIVKLEKPDVYLTKGDANPQVDSTPLPAGHVQGVGRLVVPVLGRVLLWSRSGSPARRFLVAAAAVALLCLARLALNERYDPWSPPRPATSPELDLGVDYLAFIAAMDQAD